MKNIIRKTTVFLIAAALLFPSNVAFAQFDGWTDYGSDFSSVDTSVFSNPSTDYVSNGCVGCSVSSGSGWTNYGSDFSSVNTNVFSNPSTDYVSTGCVGCNTSSSGWTNYGNDFSSVNTNVFSNPSTDYVSTGCVGCTTSNDFSTAYGNGFSTAYDYSTAGGCVGCNSSSGYTYTPGYSYTPDYTYTTQTYTTPTYTTPTYTTPTYTTQTYTGSYTFPTYTYTQPVITNPVVTNPVVTTPVVTTPTVTTCPTGTTLVNGTCQAPVVTTPTTCPTGTTLVNGVCRSTQTVPVVTNTVCSDGLAPVNGSCTRTNVVPTTSTTICSDGSYPINGSCTRTNVIPTTTVTYQTCWNGSTLPLGSVCPQQYKTCANGTSVLISQTCYYGNTYVPYTPPVTVKFNNVITSVATEITTASARCNGIGLIASGAPSTGWFEYGETANLGRETAHANIGSAPTAPFSNALVNLKPATTYYCRAVMNNQYGTVKGEIVSFTTKSVAVKYVKPVVKTTTTTTVKKTTTKSNQVVCVDGTVATVGSQKAAGLLNAGEKLVSLQIEKISGDLAPGVPVSYKLTVKNLSSESLPGTVVKVTIPAEITLTQASAGTFDPSVRTLTIDSMPLSANGEGTVLWSGVVNKDAQSGKPLVTTAYSNYSVPGSDLHDEVTAYVVGSVVPNPNGTTTDNGTGAKKVIGTTTDRGFLPDTLVEWLALIAILFIIFILGRSVYMSMQDKKDDHH